MVSAVRCARSVQGHVRRALAAAVVPLVLASGCGSDPKAPDTTAPPGFEVVKNDGAGFAIAVPAGWQLIPLTDDLDEFNRASNAIRLENPRLANAIVLARIVSQRGGELFAVDPAGRQSVNLTVDDAEENTLDEILAEIRPALTEEGAIDLADERVNLAAGPALRLRYRLPIRTDEGEIVFDEVQYFLLKEGKAYILTVIGAEAGVAATIAETLRVR